MTDAQLKPNLPVLAIPVGNVLLGAAIQFDLIFAELLANSQAAQLAIGIYALFASLLILGLRNHYWIEQTDQSCD